MRIPVIPPYKKEYASAYIRNTDNRVVVDLYKQNIDAKYSEDCLSMEYGLYVLAGKLGRPIQEGETVSYLDGNPNNTAPDNVELVQGPREPFTPPLTTPRLENINSLPSIPAELRPLGLKTNRNRA